MRRIFQKKEFQGTLRLLRRITSTMKAAVILLSAILALAVARPEAPLSPRYGPPSHHHHSGGRISHSDRSHGYQVATAAIFRNNGNARAPAPQYGPPSASEGLPLADDAAPSEDFVAPPPASNGAHSNHAQSNRYHSHGAHSNGYHSSGAHSTGSHSHAAHSNGYHSSGAHSTGSHSHAAHSNGRHTNGASNGGLSSKYGPPGFQAAAPISAGNEDPLAEPASYKFDYKVQDEEAGLDFGHQEEREGDDTKGEYYVLLPDGRIMTVTYTADKDGYKPEIKFQEASRNGKNSNGYY